MFSQSGPVDSGEHDEFLNSHLLVFNYVMDRTHPALAHQVDVVEGLAKNFTSVTVLTGAHNYKPSFQNINVISTNWVPGKNVRNVLSFYYHFFQVIRRRNYSSVFSHMTLVQSSLVAPILRVLRIKHYVWYAHAKKTFFLSWTYFWVNAILTSTRGSCPLQGSKIVYLGQSINPQQFPPRKSLAFPLRKCVHVGRMDPSKNLELIISTIDAHRSTFSNLTLTLIGNPSTSTSQEYLQNLKETWAKEIQNGWLQFENAVPHSRVREKLLEHDIFIHAFSGSLDKSLLEATLTAMPVVTINQEYLNEFDYWGVENSALGSELNALLEFDQEKLFDGIEIRIQIALKNHSFVNWISNLLLILR